MQTNTAKIHVINDKAAAALAQTAANEDMVPKRTSFLDRVKAVGNNLKNKSAKDWAWMGANVAVGAAVKFATVAALGTAISAAAAPLIAGAATAAIAGAAVGLAKSALNNARDVRDAHTSGRVMEVIDGHKPIAKIVPVDRFWSKKSLVKTAKEMAVGAGISGLTFGLLSSADIAHHIEDATGTSFTKGLSSLFNKASQAVAGTYHDLANHFTSAHTVSGPSASGIIKPAAVVAPVAAPSAPAIETPLEAPVAVTAPPVHATAVHHTHHATHHAAPVVHTVPVVTEVEPHDAVGIDDETRARALKWVAEQNTAPETASADLGPVEAEASKAVTAPVATPEPAYNVTFNNGKTIDVAGKFAELQQAAVNQGIAVEHVAQVCVSEPPTPEAMKKGRGILSYCRNLFKAAAGQGPQDLMVQPGDAMVVHDVTAPAGEEVTTYISGKAQSLNDFRANDVEATILNKTWFGGIAPAAQ